MVAVEGRIWIMGRAVRNITENATTTTQGTFWCFFGAVQVPPLLGFSVRAIGTAIYLWVLYRTECTIALPNQSVDRYPRA